MEASKLSNSIIVVNKEPYCIWGVDLRERNIEFINSIDSEYFEYIVRTHSAEGMKEEDEKRASLALRTAYYHGLETLFLLIGALIQAPHCVYAWVSKCSTGDLRSLIARINSGDMEIYTKIGLKTVNWNCLADYVFKYLPVSSEDRTRATNAFAILWDRLSREYLGEKHIAEYNCIKHGFRIKAGGFGIKIGPEKVPGIPCPDEQMVDLGHSKHGSSFFVLEKVGGEGKNNRSFSSKRICLNWSPESVAVSLELIASSIRNIIAALKITNGIKEVEFMYLDNAADFEKPWRFTPGVINCSFDFVVEGRSTTKTELLSVIRKKVQNK